MGTITDTGKVIVKSELEPGLYREFQSAAISIGNSESGTVREAIIYYLNRMGYTELTDPAHRFRYVEEQRATNEARNRHSSGLTKTELAAARDWEKTCEEVKSMSIEEGSVHFSKKMRANPLGNLVYSDFWEKVSKEMSGTNPTAWDVTHEVSLRLAKET